MSTSYDQTKAEAALRRLASDPGALTVEDIAQIAIIDPMRVERTLLAKMAGLAPPVPQPAAAAPAARTAPASTPASWEELVKARPDEPVPLHVFDVMRESFEKLTAIVSSLKTKVAALEAGRTANDGAPAEPAIKMALAPLQKQVTALRAQVIALETRGPSVSYCGVYSPDREYAVGDLCTRNGALWLALRATAAVPGSVFEAWKLIVKSGQAV